MGTRLQKSGYATDKAYANKLIKLIEDYELYRFDKAGYNSRSRNNASQVSPSQNWKHQPYKTHGLVYVIAVEGDTYEGIAANLISKLKISSYNEVPSGFPLNKGDSLFSEKEIKS